MNPTTDLLDHRRQVLAVRSAQLIYNSRILSESSLSVDKVSLSLVCFVK